MKKTSLILAMAVCRVSHFILKFIGRGGTTVPGKLALKIEPGIIGLLARETDVCAVTGTNGKTTTCLLIRKMAETSGISTISNESGANLLSGIACCLALGIPIFGNNNPKLAIIECDEAAFMKAAGSLKPKAVVVTNLFRDQLDRYGEISNTRDKIISGITDCSDAILCLNSDDPLSGTIYEENNNKAFFFGTELQNNNAGAVSDIFRCTKCHSEFSYESKSFGHLGKWSCPGCGRKRHKPDILIEALRLKNEEAEISASVFEKKIKFPTSLTSDYNAYNIAAAITASHVLGIDFEASISSLEKAGMPFGRLEQINFKGKNVRLMLAKNPAGMDCCLRMLSRKKDDFLPVFCINDLQADGTDISWLWDADFESFFSDTPLKQFGVYGLRKEDMLLRIRYSVSLDSDIDIISFEDFNELSDYILASEKELYLVANYTAMCGLSSKLKKGFRFT